MMSIPMSSPDLSDTEVSLALDVLRNRQLSIGPRVIEFEHRFASSMRVPYAVAVSSGTAALHLAMIAAEVGDGDFVITTPFSFVASSNCILYQRARPIFVDVDRLTGNIDPSLVADAVRALHGTATSRRRIPSLRSLTGGRLRAILPVHTFGQPADMRPLLEIASSEGVRLIEDACEAIGAQYNGRLAGTFGDAAAFGFYPNKQMTTGEGGMLLTANESWDQLFRSVRNQGRDVFDGWLTHNRLGYNYRMDELSAALGLGQLARLNELLEKRDRVASWYNDRLRDRPRLQIPGLAPTTTRMSWFVYVVRVDGDVDRDAVMAALAEHGIPSRPYFTPIHLQPFYAQRFGYQPGDFPIAELLGETCLALPFSSVMTEEQVDYVCDRLIGVVQRGRSRRDTTILDRAKVQAC
jgi:dTDP-4-amino-4,6-dideoxygalactose transaminase